MNDETTKEIEDLSTLACSTDEVVRKRALVSMLGRVVGRASQVDHKQGSDDFIAVERDRDALVSQVERLTANVEQARHERDTHKANVERLGHERDAARAAEADLRRLLALVRAELATTTEERDAALERNKAARVLTGDEYVRLFRDSWRAYEEHDGGCGDSHTAMLRWMEKEGYLSVRLPPDE